MIAEMLKETEKEERIAALADYRRIVRDDEPSAEDVKRLREVKRELNISDPDIEADAQAVREVDQLEKQLAASERQEQAIATEGLRSKAEPETLAAIAATVGEAIVAAPSVFVACDAARQIIWNCNWLHPTDKNRLTHRAEAAVAAFAAIPDPVTAARNSQNLASRICEAKRGRLAFE